MKTFRFTIVETQESKEFKIFFCSTDLIKPLQRIVPKSEDDFKQLTFLLEQQAPENVNYYFKTEILFEKFKYFDTYLDISKDTVSSMFRYCLLESEVEHSILTNHIKYDKSCIKLSEKFLTDLYSNLKLVKNSGCDTLEAIEFLKQNEYKHFSVEQVNTEIIFDQHNSDFLYNCLESEFNDLFHLNEDICVFGEILEYVCKEETKNLQFYYFDDSVKNQYCTIYGSYKFYNSDKKLIASSTTSEDRFDKVTLYKFENNAFEDYKYILQKAIDKFKEYLKNQIDEKFLLK